jgi:hypothetical protein
MKSMDFFARRGADPQSHCQCGKGMQRRMAEKDALSCFEISGLAYQYADAEVSEHDESDGFGPRARRKPQ